MFISIALKAAMWLRERHRLMLQNQQQCVPHPEHDYIFISRLLNSMGLFSIPPVELNHFLAIQQNSMDRSCWKEHFLPVFRFYTVKRAIFVLSA